ncbi:MAG: 4-hydroxythreonine-4-phosphate dehydrogenase PdxA, partial [Methylococcales bacterium]|nr:4-hydroxythreonine-4-phosphate dehydrogenase PdxA [Methylococcales bacterium]
MQKTRKILRIGFSTGDIHGIGPELLIRAFSNQKLKEICTPIIYGSPKVLNVFRKTLSIDKFSYNVIQTPNQAQTRKVSIIDCIDDLHERIELGKPDKQSGLAAAQALTRAVEDLKLGEIDALVTMPIDKHFTQGENFQFPGHTEFLAKHLGVEESLMFMIHEHLRVGVVTGHVPHKDVSRNITTEGIVRKLKLMSNSLKLDFSLTKPRIAVLGLNPHAGDNGLLGKEEKEKISRAIEKCSNERMIVLGPYSADGFFGSGMFKRFDAVLAMYHDQGLIPF